MTLLHNMIYDTSMIFYLTIDSVNWRSPFLNFLPNHLVLNVKYGPKFKFYAALPATAHDVFPVLLTAFSRGQYGAVFALL